MKVLFTARFERSYRRAPAAIQRAFDKQLAASITSSATPKILFPSGKALRSTGSRSHREINPLLSPLRVADAMIRAQLAFLLDNLQHPSLRAKKYDQERWQGRVTRDWRFYFRIDGDTYILLDIIAHPK